jgi:hypothetical protein
MEDKRFKYQYSYALYLISECSKNGKINEIEKMVLKKIILYQYIKIDRIVKKFEKSGDSEILWRDFKSLADLVGVDSDDEISDKSTSLSFNEDVISSPKDSALYRKKRKARTEKEAGLKEASCNETTDSPSVIKIRFL